MYEQEKIKPYHKEGDKTQQVEQMFDNIAHSYDKLNHRLSWNIDKGWRKKAIRQLLPYRPKVMLDIATGTGDFAILAAGMLRPVTLIGADISEKMMEIGRQKVEKEKLDSVISFKKEDCMNLSFADSTFDAITAAFGIRNFSDLNKGLGEMCMKQLFSIYSHTFLPLYGRMISKDRSAYDYLTATIEAFPQGEQMIEILKTAGFSKAQFKRLTFGICTMYFAEK